MNDDSIISSETYSILKNLNLKIITWPHELGMRMGWVLDKVEMGWMGSGRQDRNMERIWLEYFGIRIRLNNIRINFRIFEIFEFG